MKTRAEAKRERSTIRACEECGDAMYLEEGGQWKCHTGHTNAAAAPPSDPVRASPAPAKVPGHPFAWPTAHRRAEETELREDLRRVVETIFLDDVHGTWQELERALQLGKKRSEHAYVVADLDKVAARADRAHRLYLTAKLARDKWEAENEAVWGGMWSEATHALQTEKDSGSRSKQITDADVKARVAVMFPDEYRAQTERRRSVELTVRALERLSDLWYARMRNLDTLASKLRA